MTIKIVMKIFLTQNLKIMVKRWIVNMEILTLQAIKNMQRNQLIKNNHKKQKL